jgi:hypothetical protein
VAVAAVSRLPWHKIFWQASAAAAGLLSISLTIDDADNEAEERVGIVLVIVDGNRA